MEKDQKQIKTQFFYIFNDFKLIAKNNFASQSSHPTSYSLKQFKEKKRKYSIGFLLSCCLLPQAIADDKSNKIHILPAPAEANISSEETKADIRIDSFAKSQLPDNLNMQSKEIEANEAIKLKALQIAKTSLEARKLEQEIWQDWTNEGSATSKILLNRAKMLNFQKKYDQALQLLDEVIELDPDYAEGWNKRATILFQVKRYNESLLNISKALSLKPNHFGALAGMASIMERLEKHYMALEIYKAALDINPHLRGGKAAIERLEKKLAPYKI